MTQGFVSLWRTSCLIKFNFFFKLVKSLYISVGFWGKKKQLKQRFLLIFGVSNLELSSPLKYIKRNFSPKRLVETALEAQCNQWKAMYLFEYLVHYWLIANSSKSLIFQVRELSCFLVIHVTKNPTYSDLIKILIKLSGLVMLYILFFSSITAIGLISLKRSHWNYSGTYGENL